MTTINLQEFFQSLAQGFQASGSNELDSTIQFHLSGEGGGDWCMRIRGGQCEIMPGSMENADALLDTSAEDFVKLVTDSQEEIGWAFMQGRINMTGNIMPLWRVLSSMREQHTE